MSRNGGTYCWPALSRRVFVTGRPENMIVRERKGTRRMKIFHHAIERSDTWAYGHAVMFVFQVKAVVSET
jgi:hypothetical protein